MIKLKNSIPVLLFGIFCVFLFVRLDCSNEDPPKPINEDKCGKEQIADLYFYHDQLLPEAHYYGLNEDGFCVYEYQIPTKNSVCIDEHVWVNGEVFLNHGHDIQTGLSLYGEVVYGVLHTYPLKGWEIEYESIDDTWYFNKIANVGIKSAGNDPGWFLYFITVSFLDKGSAEKNHEYFLEVVNYIHLKARYYFPK